MTFRKISAMATLFAFATVSAQAGEYAIESHVISGGGGTSASGDIVLSGTIGQPAAGFSAAGDIELHAGFWGGGLQVIVEPDESFETWMDNLPDEDKPPPGQRGPDDEPAGDGMTNLLKYALGLLPMVPAPEAAPAVTTESGFLGIELERSTDAAVTFAIEGSDDLDAWGDVPFIEEVIDPDTGDNLERVRLITGLEANDHPKYFLRLRVRKDY